MIDESLSVSSNLMREAIIHNHEPAVALIGNQWQSGGN
jgi:hypothetical protein